MDYNIKINEQQATLIIRALAELPYKVSASLIFELQGQVKEQTEKFSIVAGNSK